MLRKAFAGLLSALLIGAATLAPGVVNAQSVSAPTDGSLLMGNIHNAGYTVNGEMGNPGGNAGGQFFVFEQETEVARNSGTATTLWAYANCTQQGANGGTCGNGKTMYMGLYNSAGTQLATCSFTYEDGGSATVGQWDRCDLSSGVAIDQGQTYYIIGDVNPSAGDQATHYGIGMDSSTSPNGQDVGCGLNTGSDPYANPPTTAGLTSSSTDCSGTGRGFSNTDIMFAATGSVTSTNPPAAIGNPYTAPGMHAQSIAAHKVQLYRFTNVPGNDLSHLIGIIDFYLDPTSTSTTYDAAIYTDVSDTPTTLVAWCNADDNQVATLKAVKGQMNSCTVSPINATPGQSYWIAIWNADGTNALVIDDLSNGNNNECYTSATLATGYFNTTFNTTGGSGCAYKFGVVAATGVN